jgi:RimJ/RimL family protein N-acetyltransferase
MRANEALRLDGERVALVPYRPQHVPTYHEWMQRTELLEATASERLTLEEEHANCRSWHDDEAKCTFIILRRCADGSEAMVGDCNLFLGVDDDPVAAEIEVMVAEEAARRGGCASEALTLLQTWAAGCLGVRRFVAKVGLDNAPSLALFLKKLGYTHVRTSEVFREETLELRLPDAQRVRCLYESLRISSVSDDDLLGVARV